MTVRKRCFFKLMAPHVSNFVHIRIQKYTLLCEVVEYCFVEIVIASIWKHPDVCIYLCNPFPVAGFLVVLHSANAWGSNVPVSMIWILCGVFRTNWICFFLEIVKLVFVLKKKNKKTPRATASSLWNMATSRSQHRVVYHWRFNNNMLSRLNKKPVKPVLYLVNPLWPGCSGSLPACPPSSGRGSAWPALFCG